MKYFYLIFFSTFMFAQTSGDLDTSFSSDGLSTVVFNDFDNNLNSIIIQNDNKIVGIGTLYEGADIGYDFGLCRLNTDGTLDTSFANNGLQLETNILDGRANCAVLQDDGKVIAAGFSGPFGSVSKFVIARYEDNGNLDTTFNSTGKLIVNLSNSAVAKSVKLQNDGKIVVMGFILTSGNPKIVILRINTNGSLDTTFDGDGILEIDVSSSLRESPNTLLIQPDGKFLIGGQIEDPNETYNDNDIFIVRLNTDGSQDNTFNSNGQLILDIYNADYFSDMLLLSDGSIVISGSSDLEFDSGVTARVTVVKLNTNGDLDMTFGNNGFFIDKIINESDALDEFTSSLLVAPDNSLYVGGQYRTTFSFNSRKGYIARFDANGNLDTSFANNGIVLLQSTINIVSSIKFDNNQKLIIGGTDTNSDDNFRFARIYVDESLSIDEIYEEDSVLIYPNPIENQLSLTIKNPGNGKAKIELLDIKGRTVKLLYHDILKESNQFFLDDVASGFYLLKFNTDKGIKTIKIIKK